MKWILVFIGGGIGSALRMAVGIWIAPLVRLFPLATLIVNMLAAGVLGGLVLLRKNSTESSVWIFLAVGFCGGLSTFSTFSLENASLLKNGFVWTALANIFLSVILCTAIAYWMSFGVRD